MQAITFTDIGKSFRHGMRRQNALSGVSLGVSTGEIFGFLGPNGAGKSTAIKILLNFIRPDKGRVQVRDLDVGRDPFQHLIGYLPETPCYYENLSGYESVIFSARAHGKATDGTREQAGAILRKLDLHGAASWSIRTYSKGMKQRLGLAMALIHDPDIYILDEPMSGLDPLGRRLITDVIIELRKRGKTVFFSSHILSDVERLCDRIGILNKGRLLFAGAVGELVGEGGSLEDAFIRRIEADEVQRDG